MPIYEYRCPNGHRFEVFQKMADPPKGLCEVCGAGPLEKLLFPIAVHFKGSGFYSTDYGKGGRKPKEGGDAGEKKKDAAPEKKKEADSGEKKAAAAD
jgi:putative FmdB family regulatory protein